MANYLYDAMARQTHLYYNGFFYLGCLIMLYKVTKQYARGSDTLVAEFNDPNDAKLFIKAKLIDDARLKVKATYRLLEGIDVLEEFSEADTSGSSSSSGGSSAGTGQRSSFQPTPFNATPRPPGLPHNWIKDDEDKKDEN